MGNYFYTGPQDIGDGGARGITAAGQGIASGLAGIAQNRQDEKMLKLKASIADQQQQTEMARQITSNAAQYGVQPVVGADGKVDIYATAAATTQKKALFNRVQAQLGMSDQADFNTKREAAARGLSVGGAPAGGGEQSNRPAMGMDAPQNDIAAPQSAVPLERQIYLADEAKKKKDFQDQRDYAAGVTRDTQETNRKAAFDQAEALRRSKEIESFRTTFGRNPGPGDLDETGNLNPASLNSMRTASQMLTLTPAQKNAAASVDAGIAAGSIAKEDRDAAIAAYEQFGGKAPAFPSSERDRAILEMKTINGLSSLRGKMSKVPGADKDPNAPYGPISYRAGMAANKLYGGNPELGSVDQAMNSTIGDVAFSLGGKTMSPTEWEAIKARTGKPTDATFGTRVSEFDQATRLQAQQHLEQLQQSPFRFTPEGKSIMVQLQSVLSGQSAASPAAAAPSSGAQPPSGWSLTH